VSKNIPRHSGRVRMTPFLSPCEPLRTALEIAGVCPLDDEWVKKAMEAAVLGLPPGVSDFRINLLRVIGRHEDTWEVFLYDEYVRQAAIDRRHGRAPQYGAPMPDEIVRCIRRIDMIVPGIKQIEIHALRRDDPYVRVIRGDESAWIAAWYGRGKRQRLFLNEIKEF